MIRSFGTTDRRFVLALVVTAALPLLTAMLLASTIIQRISSIAFQPEFSEHLDRSLELYRDLAGAMKTALRHEATIIGHDPRLRAAAGAGDRGALATRLKQALDEHPGALSLAVEDAEGELVASQRRDKPLDKDNERPFTVKRAFGGDDGPSLTVVFAADRRRFNEMEGAYEFARAYKELEKTHRAGVDRPYLTTFAVLFGLTVALALVVGVIVVRPATNRIRQLAQATRPVAEGDLTVRVPAEGNDELAELARAFNHMLEQVDRSRARIEFLKRIGQWQTMARRLAHEIKNPLTPIQLAVEECHQRYQKRAADGFDVAGFAKLLDETREIVVEEVASLRRLVGEFAELARLPRANLKRGDLGEMLRESRPRLERDLPAPDGRDVELAFELPAGELPVALDRTMLHRVLANLVQNAVQASAAVDRAGKGRVVVRASRGDDHCQVEVEDDGLGVPDALRASIFDPYMTTKRDGTGLGLTIVKKVVVDHGGDIDVDRSPLGGARFRLRLPLSGTQASEAALSQSELAPISG